MKIFMHFTFLKKMFVASIKEKSKFIDTIKLKENYILILIPLNLEN